MEFRDRLIGTRRALRPVLEEDVLVIGSEVPNLLREGQPDMPDPAPARRAVLELIGTVEEVDA